MPVSPDSLIGERYKLLDCLGAGAMGEVWKAQDTNFSRLVVVAVKLLKEDDTLADDARQRGNFERKIRREAADGPLTINVLVAELDEAFNIGVNRPALKTAAESRFGDEPITAEAAIAFFDDLSADSTYNENARHRRRLRDMFAAEANAVAVLQHPNIVRVTDYGEQQNGVPFLVMDFINGRTLQQVIQRREDMPLTRRLRLMEDLCEGLAYAHAKDLIHRDIKPANLIIDSDTQRLKILDFGVARAAQISAQRTLSRGAPIGTYCYMSPEQTRAVRTLDNRSDIFAVGLVCYELLSFQRAFPIKIDVNDLIARIQRDPPHPLRELVPNLDPAIERIVYRAIEKTPAKRYQDLLEMQREIEAIRSRLEEEEKRLTETEGGRTRLVKRKTTAQQVTDLLDRAQSAFDTEDDHAVIEFCQQIVALMPQQPDAVELKERAVARINLHAAEAAVAEGRGLIDAGDLTAADSVLRRPGLDVQLPVVRDFVRELESARQRRRVDQLVAEARTAFAAADYDETIRRANAIFDIDAANPAARDLLSQAEAALEAQRQAEIARRQAQIASTIRDADAAAAEERWEDALRLLSPITAEAGVQERIGRLEQQRAAAEARRAALDEALARSRQLFDREDFRAASLALREATQIDAGHPDIAPFDARLTPLLLISDELEGAIASFEGGDATAADAQLAHARAALEALPQRPASLQRLVESADRARAAAQQRALTRDAADALEAGRLDEGLEAARAAVAIDGTNAAARALLTQVESAIAARREQEVDAAIAAANVHAGEQRFDEALAVLSSVEHPRSEARFFEIVHLRDAIAAQKQRFAAALETARQRLAADDFAGASTAAAEARALDPSDPAALDLEHTIAAVVRALGGLSDAARSYLADDIDAGESNLTSSFEMLLEGAAPGAEILPDGTGVGVPLLGHAAVRASVAAAVRERTAAVERQRERAELARQEAERQAEIARLEAQRREELARQEAQRREELARQEALRQEELARQEAQRKEEERVARLIGDLTSRVRTALSREQFDVADTQLAQLAALPDTESAVAELRTAYEAARAAIAAREATRYRDNVRKLRKRGKLDEALVQLEAYQPPHPVIAAEIDEVRAAVRTREEEKARAAEEARLRAEAERQRREARAREEEEARRAAEERERLARLERERRIAELTPTIEQRLGAFAADPAAVVATEFDALGADINTLRELGAAANLIDGFDTQLRRERHAGSEIVRARDLVSTGRLDDARGRLEKVEPPHPLVAAELAIVQDLIDRRDEEARKAAAEEQARKEAERKLAEEQERQRQALEQSATGAILAAEALFADGEHQRAIAQLAAFEPQHPRVDAALDGFRREVARREEARRAEEERARIEAERTELVEKAAALASRAEFAPAFEALAAAERVVANHPATLQARASLVAQLRAAVQQAPADASLQALLRRYHPTVKRRRLVVVAAGVAAALALIAGSGSLYVYVTTPAPFSDRPGLAATTRTSDLKLPSAVVVEREPEPPPPPPDMATLTVDLRPWASVRITSKTDNASVPADALLTPFTITLPPGDYAITADNDGVTQPLTLSLTLQPGQQVALSREMPGFRPADIVNALLRAAR